MSSTQGMTSRQKETREKLANTAENYGFGLSNNTHLDLLNIIILAFTGIVIKIFFEENYSSDGLSGPASTTIWGYGLTSLSLLILIFLSVYLINRFQKKRSEGENEINLLESKTGLYEFFKLVIQDVTPIFLTFV